MEKILRKGVLFAQGTMKKEKKAVEVMALTAIPEDERRDWVSLAFVQAGICVCVPAFLLGALLAEEMPLWPAIISGSLGYLVVVIGMVATGIIGCDLGVASCTTCEAGFGKTGARFIVSTIFAVNMIGWFRYQQRRMRRGFQQCCLRDDWCRNPAGGIKHHLGRNHADYSHIWSRSPRKA